MPSTPPAAIRILVCYANAGAGHRRAAEAVAQATAAAFPRAEIQCRDLLDDVPAWLRRGYPATYYLLVKHFPLLWGLSFELLDAGPCYAIIQPIRRAWNLLMSRRFLQRLRREPPDLVVVTHFFPADVISAYKQAGWLTAPLVVVITDLHPHRFWLSREAEAYIGDIQETMNLAQSRGISRERLHVLGIPVASDFHASFDRHELERLFGLSPARSTVLVTSGGNTVGPFDEVVVALMDLEHVLPGRLQLLVVCGENPSAVRRLSIRVQHSAMPVRVFGFIDTMPQAMAASDLIVAKAGGLTISEALVRGVPLVLYHAIPGQERLNAQHLARFGAAVIANTPREAAQLVRYYVEHPEEFSAMRAAEHRMGRPNAAEAIVTQVMRPLLVERQ